MRPDIVSTRAAWLAPFSAAFLLLFTVGVALPTTLYTSNVGEFSITLPDLLLASVPMLVGASIACAILFRFVRVLRNPRFVALLFAVALLVWLQGNVLVWQYGPFDGRMIHWEQHRRSGLIDAAVWIAVLALAAWKFRIFHRAALTVPPLLVLMQVVTLALAASQAMNVRAEGTVKAFGVDESGKFTLSSGRNAMLIVLDEAQTDVFAEIVDSDPAYKAIFDGFTYFPDAVAGSNFTEVAIPALLTGRLYDNSVPKSEYMAEAYLGSSVLATLKRSRFRVEIYPWAGWANESMFFSPELADNLVSLNPGSGGDSGFSEAKAKEVVHLLDLSLFRSAPHALKPLIYDNQQWLVMGLLASLAPPDVKQLVSTDDRFETTVFADQATRDIRKADLGDTFKYWHVKGAHSPLMVDENLQLLARPVEFSRNAYIHQFKASLLGLQRFFSLLKQLGVFEDALIVVVGDHGSGYTEEMYVRTEVRRRARDDVDPNRNRRNFPKDKARALSLVLVKQPGASGAMSVSDTPVSLTDVPVTIARTLGVEASMQGLSMLDPVDRTGRVRRYVAFDYSENKRSYVGPMTIYGIEGHSHDDESWKVLDIITPP